MNRTRSRRGLVVAAAASTAWACVALLATPRFAAARLVPLSENHKVSASGPVHGRTWEHVVNGPTSIPAGPITARASAPGAGAALDLTFDDRAIAGSVAAASAGNPTAPDPLSWQLRSEGKVSITFSVTEPTPFSFDATLVAASNGRAQLWLLDNQNLIVSGDTEVGAVPGSPTDISAAGTLLPGHTYALHGFAAATVRTSPLIIVAPSNASFRFSLTVPEPTSLTLLSPVALFLLGRRRR